MPQKGEILNQKFVCVVINCHYNYYLNIMIIIINIILITGCTLRLSGEVVGVFSLSPDWTAFSVSVCFICSILLLCSGPTDSLPLIYDSKE